MRGYMGLLVGVALANPTMAQAEMVFEPLPGPPIFEPLPEPPVLVGKHSEHAPPVARPAAVEVAIARPAIPPFASSRPTTTASPPARAILAAIVTPPRAIPTAVVTPTHAPPTAVINPTLTTPAAVLTPAHPTPTASFVQSLPVQPTTSAAPFVLPGNTSISLRLRSAINAGSNRKGELVEFVVDQPVKVEGRIVVPRGTPAFGEIIRSHRSRGFGKGGKIEIAATRMMLNGRTVDLTGSLTAKGTGVGTGKMMLLGVLTGLNGIAQARGSNASVGVDEAMTATTRIDVALN